MNGNDGYAVFFFPQALEALGEAIKPYLQDGPAGPHVMCNGVDTGGSLIELSLHGTARDGTPVELELMIPSGMVRMIVSAHSDEMFGFGPHALKGAVQKVVAGDRQGGATAHAQDAAPVPASSSPPAADAQVDAQAGAQTPGPDADAPVASPAKA